MTNRKSIIFRISENLNWFQTVDALTLRSRDKLQFYCPESWVWNKWVQEFWFSVPKAVLEKNVWTNSQFPPGMKTKTCWKTLLKVILKWMGRVAKLTFKKHLLDRGECRICSHTPHEIDDQICWQTVVQTKIRRRRKAKIALSEVR